MNTWYFKIKGKGEPNEDITFPYGFYVNCILATNEQLSEATQIVSEDLESDGFKEVEVECSGHYRDFYWDDKTLQTVLNTLSKDAKKSPNVIHYDDFHLWELE